MNKLEIVIGSLQISTNGTIVLVIPKDACSIDTLALKTQRLLYLYLINI